MKKLIIAMLVSGFTSFAQSPSPAGTPEKTPEERAANMTRRLTAELGLSADQQQKVKEVILRRETKRQKEMDHRKALMQESEAELKAILTPGQYEKFQKRKEEMKQRRKGKDKRPAPKESITPPQDSGGN